MFRNPPAARSRRRSRARLVAWLALVAIVWPSLGPAPWLIRGALASGLEFLPHEHAHASPHHEGHAHAHPHATSEADVPGSPTHSLDHECFGCQVLKHLAHSPTSIGCVPRILPPPCHVPASYPATVDHAARSSAVVPPARAPPPFMTLD